MIQHRWSEKAAKQLEDSQTGRARAQRTARVPEEEGRAAAYVVPGRDDWDDGKPGKYCHPGTAFKHAFLYGVAQLNDVKAMPKTKATGWVFIDDDDPVLTFDRMEFRMDIGRKPTQPIYRPYFYGWGCDLAVGYNGRTITLEQVVALFDLGGFSGGIGEWRPSAPNNKSGSFGRFRITGVRG